MSKIGHAPTFSRETLGDKYDEINEARKKKISGSLKGTMSVRKGGMLGTAKRKTMKNYGFTEDGLKSLSERMTKKMTGHIPWNTGKNRFNCESIKRMAEKKRKYPENIDFGAFGWSQDRAKEIRLRDHYICQRCGKHHSSIVHHRDGDRRHNEDRNLVTVCRNCHQFVHFERNSFGKFQVRAIILEVCKIADLSA
jgi:hypothetical protein